MFRDPLVWPGSGMRMHAAFELILIWLTSAFVLAAYAASTNRRK
jgi:hypothetical protein